MTTFDDHAITPAVGSLVLAIIWPTGGLRTARASCGWAVAGPLATLGS